MALRILAICTVAVPAVFGGTVNDRTVVQFTGATVDLGQTPYWIPPAIEGTLHGNITTKIFQHESAGTNYFPLSVVDATKPSDIALRSIFSEYEHADDVWSVAFSQLIYANNPLKELSNGESEITEQNSKLIISQGNLALPEGPYFLSAQGTIHRAYRLYSDVQEAFTEAVYAAPDGSHSVVNAHVPGTSLTIAVPSRLYYKKTASKPLAGVRVGIKDIFDLNGLKTGLGNRAWYNLYPAANATATPIQRLMDAGAVIIGKQKTAQFANGEYSTADWVDYQAPFNARGDGYQDPNFSSAGAGSALASYSWVDVAIGSDTGGSTRGPARVEGLFGLRPSHGAVSLAHTMPLAPELDTAGILARDPVLLSDVAAVMYKFRPPTSRIAYPKKLLVESFPDGVDSTTISIVEQFLSGLSSAIGNPAKETLNLTAEWAKTRPAKASNSLSDMLNTTYAILIGQRQSQLVRDPFYADYAAKHPGRLPFVNPVPLVRWAFADSFPASASTEALNNKTIFKNWFGDQILKSDPITCSSAILAYLSPPKVQYRNQYRSPPGPPFNFTNQYYSVYAETSDLVVPVGQTSYTSTITNHTESLPVTINLLMAKGCDWLLLDIIKDVAQKGIIKASAVGASNVDGGEILYRRGFDGDYNML